MIKTALAQVPIRRNVCSSLHHGVKHIASDRSCGDPLKCEGPIHGAFKRTLHDVPLWYGTMAFNMSDKFPNCPIIHPLRAAAVSPFFPSGAGNARFLGTNAQHYTDFRAHCKPAIDLHHDVPGHRLTKAQNSQEEGTCFTESSHFSGATVPRNDESYIGDHELWFSGEMPCLA